MIFANCVICRKPFQKLGATKTCGPAHSRQLKRMTFSKWRAANPEKMREYSRRDYAANPERVREKVSRYYAANREKVRERYRQRQKIMRAQVQLLFAKFGKETINDLLRGL